MPDGLSFDFTEMDRLAADLGSLPRSSGPFVRAAVEFGARNVKEDWRNLAKGLPHAPAYPWSIGYDMKRFQGFGATVIEAEIGPDKEKPQGALGNLIEGGSPTSAPHSFDVIALKNEEDDFIAGIQKAEEDARKKAGL